MCVVVEYYLTILVVDLMISQMESRAGTSYLVTCSCDLADTYDVRVRLLVYKTTYPKDMVHVRT